MYRLLAIALGAIGAMSLLAVALGFGSSAMDDAPRDPGAAATAAAQPETDQAMVLKRDGSGQFHLPPVFRSSRSASLEPPPAEGCEANGAAHERHARWLGGGDP